MRGAILVAGRAPEKCARVAHDGAPDWYPQGDSASSLHSSKLIDAYRTDADANASGFVFPAAVALESLPNSGDVLERLSLFRRQQHGEKHAQYRLPIDLRLHRCERYRRHARQNIVANPGSHDGNFLIVTGLSRYLDGGRKIAIIDGENDPIHKDGTSDLADSWTMDNRSIDFGTVIGKCTGQSCMDSSEPAVGVAWGSGGTAHRFAIPLSCSARWAHVGERLHPRDPSAPPCSRRRTDPDTAHTAKEPLNNSEVPRAMDAWMARLRIHHPSDGSGGSGLGPGLSPRRLNDAGMALFRPSLIATCDRFC